MREDILIEIARTMREAAQAVDRRVRARQQGEAFAHIERRDHGSNDHGREQLVGLQWLDTADVA